METGLPRERLPETRECVTRRIELGGVTFYPRVGCYPDGRPGELFVTQAGESGSHVACLLDSLGVVTSLALQYGVPLRSIVEHFRGMRSGDVCGVPSADDLLSASSFPDALARWFAQRWPEFATGASLPPPPVNVAACDATTPPVAPADGPSGAAGGVKGGAP